LQDEANANRSVHDSRGKKDRKKQEDNRWRFVKIAKDRGREFSAKFGYGVKGCEDKKEEKLG